jgi:hypothetical protein
VARYRTGHIPDTAEAIAARKGLDQHPGFGARIRPALGIGALPLRTNNAAKLPRAAGGPGLLNQTDCSGCEGHAHASGGTLFFACEGTPLPDVISPVGLYLGALMIDQQAQANPDGSLPLLYDFGTMPESIQKAWAKYGATGAGAWGQMPAGTATLYQNPNDQAAVNADGPLIQPAPEQLASEFSVKFGGAYFIQTAGLQKVLQLLAALAAGYQVSDAIAASGPAFQGYTGGIITGVQMTGDIDHANLVIDYAWTGAAEQFTAWQGGASGLDQYLVGYGVNSWGGVGCPYGGDWGEANPLNGLGGQYRFDRTFVDNLQSPLVLDLQRSA